MIKNGETISRNRKSSFNYEIEDKIEAGIALMGSEVKSLRNARVNLENAYVGDDEKGELCLFNLHIAEYKFSARFGHAPTRPRRVLVHKREKNKILSKINAAGYSLIPITMYFNKRGMVKLLLGIGKGKKLEDKRATIKEREWNRNKARILKRHDKE